MTANQYLASIGIGPVNEVCSSCGAEVGRVWTPAQICLDCVRRVRPPALLTRVLRGRAGKFPSKGL